METRKSLFRKVERAIEAIDRSPDVASTIAQTAAAVIENFREDLGVRGGRLYERRDGGYEITRTFGGVPVVAEGTFVADTYPPVERVVDEGVVVMDLTAPGVDPEFERKLGAERFAAIAVGDDEYILSFTVDPTAPDEDLMSSLGIMRLAVDQKLRQNRIVSALNEARQIQMSILPKRSFRRGSVEVAGFTAPAEIVGGDYFDFIPLSDRILGVAIADASGHGLPAAIQVRDVYTGLRMGVERDFKIVRTVEKLNRIINQSRMTTRFVSLFYCEIEEDDGNLMYVNAGHPPPLHFHSTGVTLLKQTGMVLGPSATSTYSRGFRSLERGDALLMYTDGMFEAHDSQGQEFGLDRLREAFLALRERPADEIARKLIDAVREYAGGREPEDDQTVVVIKRGDGPPPAPASSSGFGRQTDGLPRFTG